MANNPVESPIGLQQDNIQQLPTPVRAILTSEPIAGQQTQQLQQVVTIADRDGKTVDFNNDQWQNAVLLELRAIRSLLGDIMGVPRALGVQGVLGDETPTAIGTSN